MNQIFKSVDKFFASLNSYIGLADSFMIFVGLFLLVAILTFVATSKSYEAKLIKAIDMLNGYFVNNPKITEDNLVLFNQIMRHNKVPKLLRKHWQQFMLYRENNASFYMSFENCVAIPLRNSKFKRDKVIMNLFAYILAGASLLINTYLTAETADIAFALQRIFLAPIVILLINFILSIVLDLKESAIINDLNQNYQYFETNIDKATKSLPDYVDYEILFDKAEIKKGIPVLYQYLQKRAEDEQRELELARLKNVEHEKFNFDEAGLAGSLVLERAMQEAENYIAERKKYGEDIAQINSEIAQEDINYREITKEYNRQMQVSKETFANFKKELEEATSTIQANYLKKQQQQELDRQRNLERDFDTATDRHKKVIESYQAELDSIDNFIAESRKSLQDAMMAEFATYSGKVYDEAKKVVEEREKEKYKKVKQEIKNLEEQLYTKNKEIVHVEDEDSSQGANEIKPEEISTQIEEVPSVNYLEMEQQDETQDSPNANELSNKDKTEQIDESLENEWGENLEEAKPTNNWNFDFEPKAEENTMSLADFDKQNSLVSDNNMQDDGYQSYSDFLKEQNIEPFNFGPNTEEKTENKSNSEENSTFDWFDDNANKSTVQEDESTQEGENFENKSSEDDEENGGNEDFDWFDEILDESNEDDEEPEDEALEIKPENIIAKKKPGRPRKVVSELVEKSKRRPGRPKKVVELKDEQPAKKRGRPRKEKHEIKVEEAASKRGRGRPKKVKVENENVKLKRRVGRPKKESSTSEAAEIKRKPGRPKKKKVGRPKKVVQETPVEEKSKKKVGRPKKERQKNVNNTVKKRGRPKKVNLNNVDADTDLEAYLKVIDNAIAKENAKIKRSQRALENNANIKTKKKK